MSEEKECFCEELDEQPGTVEYGFEEPSSVAVNPGEPGRPRITHMSGIKPDDKETMSNMMKILLVCFGLLVLLVISGYFIMTSV